MAIIKQKPVFDDIPDWPDAPAPAPKDHNKPPLEEIIPLEFREELLRERPDFLTRLDDLIGAADRAHAEDDESLGKCGDLVKAYRAAQSHIDATHKAVKQPYLDGGRLVDAQKNALTATLSAAKRKVEDIGNTFVAKRDAAIKAEQERLAAEQRAAADRAAAAERERQRAEEEAERAALQAASEEDRRAAAERAEIAAREAEQAMADAALAPAATKVEPVRSDAGATISGKQEWKSEVLDFDLAYIAVSDDEKVREAIEKAVARRVRAGARNIDGARIWPVAVANYR